MKRAAGPSSVISASVIPAVILALFSVNSWAQESDINKRNTHIFCSSHLAIVGESLDKDGDQRQALATLSRMHREVGRELGATEKHFQDVVGYLKTVRNEDEAKWSILSAQSRDICLPGSE